MKINILAVKNGDKIKFKGKAKIIKILKASAKKGVWQYKGGRIIMSKYNGSLYDVKMNPPEIKIVKSKIVDVI